MIKILVCFYMSPDLDGVSKSEWRKIEKTSIDLSRIPRTLATYDEAALEGAARIKDALNDKEVELTAITIDNDDISLLAKRLFAIHYNNVVQVKTTQQLIFSPRTVAHIISDYATKQGPFDLILMGQQSSVGNNNQTHIRVAHNLTMPVITHAIEVVAKENSFVVTHKVDNGTITKKITHPALISFGDARYQYLREATLRERLKVKACKETVIDVKEMNLSLDEPSPTILQRLIHENKDRLCKFIEGESPREKAEKLYETYLKEAVDI